MSSTTEKTTSPDRLTKDSKIVTARAPIDLAAFVHAIDDLLVARNAQKRSGLHFGYTTVTHSDREIKR